MHISRHPCVHTDIDVYVLMNMTVVHGFLLSGEGKGSFGNPGAAGAVATTGGMQGKLANNSPQKLVMHSE